MTIDKADPTEKQGSPTRRLILMRHAKSDWADESLADHDRPLNARGRRSAPDMAEWLRRIDAIPDAILTSSSRRTRETMELMLPVWSTEPEVFVLQSLYLAGADSILQTIREDGSLARTLLVLGHNPGMSHLVSHLTDKFMDMPTAAAAVFQLRRDDWELLEGPDDVKLVDFMRPKALR